MAAIDRSGMIGRADRARSLHRFDCFCAMPLEAGAIAKAEPGMEVAWIVRKDPFEACLCFAEPSRSLGGLQAVQHSIGHIGERLMSSGDAG
ncbi:MAG TPA: hypothetical protein VHX12_07555 [Acidisoma sp.]|nr:hypothetical protein [Acidisoma sp.]